MKRKVLDKTDPQEEDHQAIHSLDVRGGGLDTVTEMEAGLTARW